MSGWGMAQTRKAALRKAQGEVERDPLAEQRLVLRAAAAGSFSAAARSLGVQVSTISRAVGRMESHLGIRLFARTTRGLKPTDAGVRYLEHLREWIGKEDTLRASIAEDRDAKGGRLRVTVPAIVASRILPDTITRVRQALPGLQLEVHATDAVVDLVQDGVDLAIRLGPLPSSTLRTRRVARFRRVLVASPAWLATLDPLEHPSDLERLPCLAYASSAQPVRWRFVGPRGRRVDVLASGPVRANDAPLLVSLAERGGGMARVVEWLAEPALAKETLVQVLPEWRCDGPGAEPAMMAVWPDDPAKTSARRGFLAALERSIRGLGTSSILVRGDKRWDR